MKISCIIPVYNTSKYLKQCIDSVLNQTYTNFEIILINDCSTDNSGEICRQYYTSYPNQIHYFDKPSNQGVDYARFSGLSKALQTNSNGGIVFIDSDDYIEKDAFRKLVEEMDRTDCDVVEMRSRRVWGPIKRSGSTYTSAQVIEQPQLFDDFFISFFGVNRLSVSMWLKLYRADTIAQAALKPTGYKMGEDLMFNMKLFPHIKRYSIIDYCGYNYRVGGLTTGYNPFLWENLKCQYHEKRQFALDYNYTKALRTLNIELKNVLISVLCQRLEYLKESDNELTHWLNLQLTDRDLWAGINNMATSETEPVYKYIAESNTQAIITLARERMKSSRFRWIVKKILSYFIR